MYLVIYVTLLLLRVTFVLVIHTNIRNMGDSDKILRTVIIWQVPIYVFLGLHCLEKQFLEHHFCLWKLNDGNGIGLYSKEEGVL